MWIILFVAALTATGTIHPIPFFPQTEAWAQPDTSTGEAGPVPHAEIPEPAHHLGKISTDREIEHTFTIRNTGRGVLQIRDVVVG